MVSIEGVKFPRHGESLGPIVPARCANENSESMNMEIVNKITEASSIEIPTWRGIGFMKEWFLGLIEAIELAMGRVDKLE